MSSPVDLPVLDSSDTASLKVLGYADDLNLVTTLDHAAAIE